MLLLSTWMVLYATCIHVSCTKVSRKRKLWPSDSRFSLACLRYQRSYFWQQLYTACLQYRTRTATSGFPSCTNLFTSHHNPWEVHKPQARPGRRHRRTRGRASLLKRGDPELIAFHPPDTLLGLCLWTPLGDCMCHLHVSPNMNRALCNKSRHRPRPLKWRP